MPAMHRAVPVVVTLLLAGQALLAPTPARAAAVAAAVSGNIVNIDPYPTRRVEFPGGVAGLPDLTYTGVSGYRSLKLDLYLPPASANADLKPALSPARE
jgi:hypothetical protein